MGERYVNPFTDFGFKRLFGSEPNKDLLIDFLNQLLGGKETVCSLTWKPFEQLGAAAWDRRAVYDLYCENEKGEKFIVEMQKAEQKYFKDRSVYYSTFPIQEQAVRGEWDFRLKEVYTVGVLDFAFDDDDQDKLVVVEVKLMETGRRRVFFDKLTYIYLQMPNFDKGEEDLATPFDKWLYVLKNLPRLRERPARLQGRVFSHLFEVAEIAAFTKAEKDQYEESLKVYRDLINTIGYAEEKGLEKGRQMGLEEGRQMGLEEGRQMGFEEGEKVGVEKGGLESSIRIAEKLLPLMDDGRIAAATGLTVDRVSSLRAGISGSERAL